MMPSSPFRGRHASQQRETEHVCCSQGRRARYRKCPSPAGARAARRQGRSGIVVKPDLRPAFPGGRPRHDRGLALRSRIGCACDQAGARRHDRGDFPAARIPRHPAALRLQRAYRHRHDAGPPPGVVDVQGYSRRTSAGADLRLHPPPARSGLGRRKRTGFTRARQHGAAAGDAARNGHSRSGRLDRTLAAGHRRPSRRRSHARVAELSRGSGSALAEPRARR
ncbi:hypothetical protein BN961_04002 [Afipia felis]|uniref:Uncharacterized protein n=1 Tax=Afipia felis TaxID=1035 RepID=A0A090MVJ7_AFIFE|nr:hypothetical protein BN961_04002 [Afipia felis]